MKRIAKCLAVAALVLALLLATGGWCVNRWLQSAAGRASIEGKMTEALHLPIKIESLGFSAWGGLAAKKISVTGPDGILFEAAGISARHRLSSLLRGSLALDEVRIEQPHFRLIEDASGKWSLPHNTAPKQSNVAAIAPAKLQPAAATNPAKPAGVFIGKIIIEGGTAEMIDKAHTPFATVTGLNVTLNGVTESGFSGNIAIERAILHGWIALDHLSSLATRTGQEFQIRQLTAGAGGGSITGEATFNEGSTGSASLKLSLINLDSTTQDGGMTAQKISGVLSGDAQIAGLGGDTKAITGKGTLSLKSGDCTQFEFLRQIGDALRLASLANFQIADATANFQIANGQFVLSPVDVSAPPVGVALNGPIAFDGTLNLSAILHAPASLIERQPVLAAQFSPPDSANRRGVQFNITGTMKKPRQNLAERLTGTKDRKQQRIIAAEAILSALTKKSRPQPEQPAPVPAQQ